MKLLQRPFTPLASSAWLVPLLFLLQSLPSHASPPPLPGINPWLDSWSFEDTNQWTSGLGFAPVSFTNLSGSSTGDGNALVVDSIHPAWLRYKVWQTNATNITVNQGSVSFWFAPNWSGTNQYGSGPQVSGRLVEAGVYTTNASGGWWSILLDPQGCHIYLSAQNAAGQQTNYLAAPISWTNSTWHNVVVTYSRSNSSLYLDGSLATNGPGMSIYPNSQTLSNGFTIGSDAATGIDQAHGSFDDFYTYSYPLTASSISMNFELFALFYGAEASPSGHFAPAPSTPETLPTFEAVTGPGFLVNPVTNFNGCVTSNQVWITNCTASVTNDAVNLTFTIAGGSNAYPYDVFATAALDDPITNAVWVWLGQGYKCVTYTIPSLTNSAVFLLLGTPLDSDDDGLTDAYERLVSHTNPYNPSSSGDGMLDGWKVLWGMNPTVNNSAQPSQRCNYIFDGTGRLETVSGAFAEVFGFDAEGNIQSDQP